MKVTTSQAEQKSESRVVNALSNVLADAFVLTMKTRHYHWNVTCPFFVSLHTLFNEIYDMLDTAGDDIAERIRALNHVSHGNYAGFLKKSIIKEELRIPTSLEMVNNLTHDLESFSSRLNEAKEIALKAGDDGTADLLIGYIRHTDKFSWMLRSHLG